MTKKAVPQPPLEAAVLTDLFANGVEVEVRDEFIRLVFWTDCVASNNDDVLVRRFRSGSQVLTPSAARDLRKRLPS